MDMEETLNMSNQEIDKLRVIRDILEGRWTWNQAAQQLDLSIRQVGRLCARVRQEGNRGVIHQLRSRPSNHQLDARIVEQALSTLHTHSWEGFGPTFAQQKLKELYHIILSEETLRQLMILTDIWQPHQRRAKHRAWRERRPRLGMLVQLDGSDHDWFEGRGPRCVLIAYVDDATSQILHGEFAKVEDTWTLMRTTKTYLLRYGRPLAFYVDKDSIYKINRQPTVEEDLQDRQPLSQFTRAMQQLSIEMTFAHSPQAKGRVERNFRTHQDRLVKEMRLRGICDVSPANRYLWTEYLPQHNERYAVEPAEPGDTHRPLLACQDLDVILALQTPRIVQNDFTIQYQRHFFQLLDEQPVRVLPKDRILVVEGLDGRVRLAFKGRYLKAQQLTHRPYRSFYHPRLRSTGASTPPAFYGEPKLHSPLPDAFKSFQLDPVLALRRRVERESLLENS